LLSCVRSAGAEDDSGKKRIYSPASLLPNTVLCVRGFCQPGENKKYNDKICELKNAAIQTLFKNPSHDFAIPR
jgi:hypothetical protein